MRQVKIIIMLLGTLVFVGCDESDEPDTQAGTGTSTPVEDSPEAIADVSMSPRPTPSGGTDTNASKPPQKIKPSMAAEHTGPPLISAVGQTGANAARFSIALANRTRVRLYDDTERGQQFGVLPAGRHDLDAFLGKGQVWIVNSRRERIVSYGPSVGVDEFYPPRPGFVAAPIRIGTSEKGATVYLELTAAP